MARSQGVTDADIAKIRAYVSMGYSNTEIANAVGRATSTIADIRNDKHRYNTVEREALRCLQARKLHSAWDAQARAVKRAKHREPRLWR